MRFRGKVLRTAATTCLVVALSVSLAGCGGSGGASEDGGDAVKVLKIGVGAPLTSGAAEFGQGIDRGAKLAVMDANERDDVKALNIKFEVKSGDDAGDPKTGVNLANQFISDAALVGVMGHLQSGVSMPASKIYEAKNIPMISPSSTDPALTGQGFINVFRTVTRDDVQGPAAAERAFNELGAKTAFLVDDSTNYGAGLATEFGKKFEALGGKVLGAEKGTDKETEFSSMVTKIKAANPDIVYYGGMYTTAALFAKQLRSGGVTAGLYGGDGLNDPTFIELAGPEGSKDVYCTAVGAPTAELPKAEEFKAAYEKAFPGKAMAAYDAYAYDATTAIIEGVIKVAQDQGVPAVTTDEGRKSVCEAIHAITFEGVTGQFSFDKNGDTSNKVITTYVVKDGAWTVLK